GEAYLRRVLQRHPRTRVDLLRLAEHEGLLATFRHRRGQPLQAGRLRCGAVGDANALTALRRLDRQLAAQRWLRVGQGVLEIRPLAVRTLAYDLFDGQVTGIEHQLRRFRIDP